MRTLDFMEAWGSFPLRMIRSTASHGLLRFSLTPDELSPHVLVRGQGASSRTGDWLLCLGPPVVPFTLSFFGEGSPTKVDYREKIGYQLIQAFSLEDLVVFFHEAVLSLF